MVFGVPTTERRAASTEAAAQKRGVDGGDGGVKPAKSFSVSPFVMAVVNNDVASIKAAATILSPQELTEMLFFASALKTTTGNTILLLVDAGADIHFRDSSGRTPLHDAASFGNADTAVALVKAGADIDAVSRDGNTAMLEAAKFKHYDVVAVLADLHANTGVRNRWGRTAVPEVELALLLRKKVE